MAWIGRVHQRNPGTGEAPAIQEESAAADLQKVERWSYRAKPAR